MPPQGKSKRPTRYTAPTEQHIESTPSPAAPLVRPGPKRTIQSFGSEPLRILVIEDNAKLAQAIKHSLVQHGYSVDVACTGGEGDELAGVEHYDLIILDLMLPDRDGLEVCRSLRRRKITTPILMLSALGSTEDKVAGLDAGADDYLTKPFQFVELFARLRSLLRRSHASEGTVLESRDLRMDLQQRRVTMGGEPVRLSAKEFALLEYMMRNPGKLLTRSMISESIWDMNHEAGSNVIEVYVSRMRRKIDRGLHGSRIETAIGSGYRFLDPLQSGGASQRTAPAS